MSKKARVVRKRTYRERVEKLQEMLKRRLRSKPRPGEYDHLMALLDQVQDLIKRQEKQPA